MPRWPSIGLPFHFSFKVLFVFIKSNENIKGIEIFKYVFLFTAFADDSTFFLRDNPSIKELINSFNQFYHFSSLKANIEKLEIAGIAAVKEVTEVLCGLECMDLSNDTIKILGIHFSYVCISGSQKCSFFGTFGVLCFLETPILRFALLLYYRPNAK